MNVALDFDGVITANVCHYAQLADDLLRSGHEVYVLTGANCKRFEEVEDFLFRNRFPHVAILSRPEKFRSTHKNIGLFKKQMLREHRIDLWFDNEVKIYEQAGVDFSDLKTEIIRI